MPTVYRDGVAYTDGAMHVAIASGSTIPSPTFTGTATFADGLVSAPSLAYSSGGGGWWANAAGQVTWETSNTSRVTLGQNVTLVSSSAFRWASGDPTATSADTSLWRASANSVLFNGATTASTVTSRTEINKAVTAFSNAAAKTVFTLTIPNAAHSATYEITVCGSLGAGGAIGANEASATNKYQVTIARTAGVNAVAAISSAYGAAAAAVAGAATVTCTAALAAVSGAVGATNTIDILATISRSGGSSDNHTCVAHAVLLNANATGITIA